MDDKELKPTEEVKTESSTEPINQSTDAPAAEVEKPAESKKIEALPEGEDFEATIEAKRAELLVAYKKAKMVSRIFTGIVLGMVIAAIILVPMEHMAAKIIGFALAGIALATMIVFYLKTRNDFPNTSKIYINNVTGITNSYVFQDKRFSDVESLSDKKLSKTELALDRVYKEGIEAGSRNPIKGKFDGKEFDVIEAAVYYQSDNKRNPRKVGFLGKYVTLKNALKFEGRYVFWLKNSDESKVADKPTDLEDLEKVYDEDSLEIYGPRKDYNEVFGTKFIKKLREIKVNEPLLNLVVVAWAGHTAAYLSYDDSVTTLPFEHEFKKEPTDKYRDDLVKVLELLGSY